MGSQISRGGLPSEPAFAKINLSLRVTERRADGYHLIESLVTFADLGERLTVRISDRVHLDVTGPMGRDLAQAQNLVLAADAAFRQAFPQTPALAYELEKHIPVAAGLGGGSADAAAAFRLLANLGGVALDHPEIARMAVSAGADVAVCLSSQPALVSGIGEEVRVLQAMPNFALVLVNPRIALSTPKVFGALGLAPGERMKSEAAPVPGDNASQIERAVIDAKNDLQGPALALVPQIGGVIDAIARERGCIAARMSGSGATCFGVYSDAASAEQAAHNIAAARPGWWVRAVPSGGAKPAALM